MSGSPVRVLLVMLVMVASCSSETGRGSTDYGSATSPDGLYVFDWLEVDDGPAELLVVRVSDAATGDLLFLSPPVFRQRDVNVAGWVDGRTEIIAHSGDTGPYLIARDAESNWTFAPLDRSISRCVLSRTVNPSAYGRNLRICEEQERDGDGSGS